MQPFVGPVVVVTVTGAMQLDRAAWLGLADQADLIELRLDTLGENAGPLTPTMVAPMLAHVRSLLPNTPLLATATRAPEAAGQCTSRAEVLELLRAAVQAGVDWFDLDVSVALTHADEDNSDEVELTPAGLRALNETYLSIVGTRQDVRCVISTHQTFVDGAQPNSANPLDRLDKVARELKQLGHAIGAIKFIAVHAVNESDANQAALSRARERATLGLIFVFTQRIIVNKQAPAQDRMHLAMFAGGESGAHLRPIATALGSDWIYAAAAVDPRKPVPGQWTVRALRAMWPNGQAPAWGTPVYGIVGERVAGSASPALFTALFERTGMRGVYGRFDVGDPGYVFALLGTECLPFAGMSVTAPHKGRAWGLGGGDRETGGLKGLGAYNTLVKRAESKSHWRGFNTDLLGVRAAAEALVGEDWFARPRQVVVLGAGGAARAVLKALGEPRATAWGASWLAAWRTGAASLNTADLLLDRADPASDAGANQAQPAAIHSIHSIDLIVLARDPKRAIALAREFGAGFGGLDELASLQPDLVVHATPLGSPASSAMHAWLPGAAALAALAQAAPNCAILDANYKPNPTPLVAAARALGLRAATGRHWFWAQAAAQFAIFASGQQPVDLPASAEGFEALLGFALPRPAIELLIGPRGAGKTTAGRAWAAASGASFRDLDVELAAAHGAGSAGELLAAVGEAPFRSLETEFLEMALAASSANERQVWASGGGLVTTPVARAALAAARASGLVRTTWLTAEPAVLAARVAADPTLRPALFGSASELAAPDLASAQCEAERSTQQRAPWYRACADRTLDVSSLDLESVTARLLE